MVRNTKYNIQYRTYIIPSRLGNTYVQINIDQHAQISLAPNEMIQNVIGSSLPTNSKDAPKAYQTSEVLYAKQPTLEQKSRWIEG